MAKLSAIIPSRDERFLVPTIEDIFRNARGEIEVVAVLDSPNWPDNWADVTAKYPNLHTIHNGKSLGMRASINRGVASAISRRAKFIMKTDAHCSFSEGFDEVLKAECEPNWVVIPRRGRLDPEQWTATDTHKPDIDYHYLSFPDDPNDFGGPGLNGKVWAERAVERRDILLDEEMSSQGSCWFMHAKYFQQLELMDEASYGMFWNEMQEIGLKAWLSGGQLMINKKAKYLHLHKGKKYGRGYRLEESQLQQGRTYTMKWLFNEAWPKQTLPFKSLIERFWPVPTWPEDWERQLYQGRTMTMPVKVFESLTERKGKIADDFARGDTKTEGWETMPQLQIHAATYGLGRGLGPDADLDVTERLQSLVKDDSLDIVINNATLCPDRNPYRGKKKKLWVTYSINGSKPVTVERQEKEWLIIGPVRDSNVKDFEEGDPQGIKLIIDPVVETSDREVLDLLNHGYASASLADAGWLPKDAEVPAVIKAIDKGIREKFSAPALNDYLIRKFHISDRRLRAPMPVELRDFNRNDLAKLFAELGFTRGCEVGVAEGKFSEVLLQANPQCGLLLLVDPWHRYSENPQNKPVEKHEFAYNETLRRTKDYPCVQVVKDYSMNAVRDVNYGSLDWVYIDGQHQFDFCMQDLIEWSKRVRSGGIVSGDDYYELDRKRWGAGPVEAVQAYTKAHGIALWFICDAPNSVDYFWVRP